MNHTSNLKLPYWLKMAKQILADDLAAVECLNRPQLFHYINDKVPITNKLTLDYFTKLMNEDYTEKSGASIDTKLTAEELRKTFRDAKIKAELSLYKRMKTNDKCFQRELSILERRFNENWKREQSIDLKADQNIKQNVSITFKQV